MHDGPSGCVHTRRPLSNSDHTARDRRQESPTTAVGMGLTSPDRRGAAQTTALTRPQRPSRPPSLRGQFVPCGAYGLEAEAGPQISFRGTVFDDSGQVIKVAVGGDEIGEPVPALACLQVLVDLPG